MPCCERSIFSHCVTRCWNSSLCRCCILWGLCWSRGMIGSYCFIGFEEAVQGSLIVSCSTVKLWSASIQSWLTKPYRLLQSKFVWRSSHWPCKNCYLFQHAPSSDVHIQSVLRCRNHWSNLPSKACLCSNRSQRECWVSFDCFALVERISSSAKVGYPSLSFIPLIFLLIFEYVLYLHFTILS